MTWMIKNRYLGTHYKAWNVPDHMGIAFNGYFMTFLNRFISVDAISLDNSIHGVVPVSIFIWLGRRVLTCFDYTKGAVDSPF